MKILAVSSVTDRKTWANGDQLLAFFDCEFAGLRLRKCLLIRASRGFLLAQPPRAGVDKAEGRPVEIVDPEIRKAMAVAAHNAFLAMGGTEEAAA